MSGNFSDLGATIQELLGDSIDDFEFVDLTERAVDNFHGISASLHERHGDSLGAEELAAQRRAAVYEHCDY